MKTIAAITSAALGMSVSLAQSAEKCSVAMTDWKPRAELEAMLTQNGWDVRSIKSEDGCYEAYAIDDKGHKVEAYFNPQTFERIDNTGEDEG